MIREVLRVLLIPALLLAVTLPPAAALQERAGETGSQEWTGTLVDAECKARDAAQPCEISAATTSYGLVTADGKLAKFDRQGNSMAATKLRGKSGKVSAKVTGKMNGDTLEVQQLEIT
jgi:hypothetical protein